MYIKHKSRRNVKLLADLVFNIYCNNYCCGIRYFPFQRNR